MTDSSTRLLRLAVCQFAPRLGDLAGNAQRIAELARHSDADLLLFPELALTGYDVRDRVHELAIEPDEVTALLALPKKRAALVGFIQCSPEAIPYNAAALIAEDTQLHLHRKVYLPTYGMFDEGRYFGRGQRIDSCTIHGLRVGVLICEDFWHPSLCYLLACQHIDLLLVLAAAPGRGAWQAEDQRSFASTAVWERMVRTTAALYGIYVALCNRVGVEGGVSFAGGSMVVDPSGDVMAVAHDPDEVVLEALIDSGEIARARKPYAHLRDEDPHLVLRELKRIMATHD